MLCSFAERTVERVIVYWDLVVLMNGAADYLLLLTSAYLAGRTVPRRRLICAAALGAVYAAARLVLSLPWAVSGAAFLAMTALAFAGTGRWCKLSLLTLLLSCALGGGVMLLGEFGGSLRRVARGMVCAQLPWGVFLLAAGGTYLLLSVAFRGGAKHDGADFVRVRITCGGSSVSLRLLRDSGNLLADPGSGKSVPVIGESALRALLPQDEDAYITLRCATVNDPCGTLRAFRCDSFCAGGTDLGPRLIAVAPDLYGDGGFQGIWRAEEKEERNEAIDGAVA